MGRISRPGDKLSSNQDSRLLGQCFRKEPSADSRFPHFGQQVLSQSNEAVLHRTDIGRQIGGIDRASVNLRPYPLQEIGIEAKMKGRAGSAPGESARNPGGNKRERGRQVMPDMIVAAVVQAELTGTGQVQGNNDLPESVWKGGGRRPLMIAQIESKPGPSQRCAGSGNVLRLKPGDIRRLLYPAAMKLGGQSSGRLKGIGSWARHRFDAAWRRAQESRFRHCLMSWY